MSSSDCVVFLRRSILLTVMLLTGLSFVRAQTQRPAVGADSSLSALEQEVLQELNLARTKPAEYAWYLEQLRPLYRDKMMLRPGKQTLVTKEGLSALEEAIRFLRAAKPLPPFRVSQGMCLGARAHVMSQGPTGSIGHRGADGSLCDERLNRFGAWQETVGENLSYGDDAARDRVVAFLIDDGVANRGHRNRIFNPQYKVVGVSCGAHSLMGAMCAITFAGNFVEKPGGGSSISPDRIGNRQIKRF